MKLKPLLAFCALALITTPAFCGDLKPAMNADPTYPTKDIKKINVVGVLDSREDKTLELDLPEIKWYVQYYLTKKGYKCEDYSPSPPSAAKQGGVKLPFGKHKKSQGMILDDSLMTVLTKSDLTDNYKSWLAALPPEAGNPICVLVIDAAESERDGGLFQTHAILTGYMFDREKQSIVWIDKAEDSGKMAEAKRSTDPNSISYTWTDAHGAAVEQIRQIITGKLLDSFPKKGKNFVLPLEHTE